MSAYLLTTLTHVGIVGDFADTKSTLTTRTRYRGEHSVCTDTTMTTWQQTIKGVFIDFKGTIRHLSAGVCFHVT